jgi:hypothetical protein
MATAFYGTFTITGLDKRLQVDRFDSTDVTLAFSTWTSAGGNTFLTVIRDGYITDIVLNIASAGTTKDFKLWINQTDTNIRWVQSACFPALATHFPNLSPIPVKAGDVIMIQVI